MKRVINFVQRNSLNILSCAALLVGTMAVSSASVGYIQQVKCPEELLK